MDGGVLSRDGVLGRGCDTESPDSKAQKIPEGQTHTN